MYLFLGDNIILFQIGTGQKQTTIKIRKRFLRIDGPNKLLSVKTQYSEFQLRYYTVLYGHTLSQKRNA